MKNSEIFKKILELNKNGSRFVLVTVIETKGSGPSETGGRMIFTTDGDIFGTIGGGTLEKLVLKEAGKVLLSGESALKRYLLDKDKVLPDSEKTGMLCGGEVTLFLEYTGVDDNIYIFGAGHIGKNLIKFLKDLNYRIIIVDDREDVLDGISGQMKIHYKDPGSIFNNIEITDNSYVVIATYSHELDYAILKEILERKFKPEYLGVVASGKKIDTMISKLKKEMKGPLDTSFLFSPAGLDIGGRTPVEIALSIVSEIQAKKYDKQALKHLSKDFRN
ncbi:MAG: XdhC family protein [Candidatus Aminicenantes bacterium]|nr:XdhC family protein [Candidatus Aminicenantes bacterium]